MDAALRELTTGTSSILNLFCRQLSSGDVLLLASALADNKTVTDLNLTANKIGDAGASALAAALSSNTTLETMNLSDNRITDAGAFAIADLLSSGSCSLKTLYLSGNGITDKGMDCMSKALEERVSIRTIYISGNQMSREVALRLGIALKPCMVLTCVAVCQSDAVEISCFNLAGSVVSSVTLPAGASTGDLHDALSGQDGLAGRNLYLVCSGRAMSAHDRDLGLTEAFDLPRVAAADPEDSANSGFSNDMIVVTEAVRDNFVEVETRDAGISKGPNVKGEIQHPCYRCGGPHFASGCPTKSKGKGKGRSKGKGKSKTRL